MLDVGKQLGDVPGTEFRNDYTKVTVEFVGITNRNNLRVILVNSTPVTEPGRTFVPGACVNF
jgi:hypothetical protein